MAERADDEALTLEQQAARLIREARAITRATKTRIRIFVAIVVMVLVGLAGLAVATLQAHSAISKANQAIVAACEAGNDYRQQDHDLWTKLFALTDQAPPRHDETSAERERREHITAQIKAFIEDHDRLRACRR